MAHDYNNGYIFMVRCRYIIQTIEKDIEMIGSSFLNLKKIGFGPGFFAS